jgi:hypothetical protein
MGLFDFLQREQILNENAPNIKSIQMDAQGNVYNSIEPETIKQNVLKRLANNVTNAIIGKPVKTTDSIGLPRKDETGNVIVESSISNSPRTGGFLRDLTEGYKENRTTPFSVNNLGEKRNNVYRFGEGLGSFVRFAESPLGRGLITAGMVGATGGNASDALAYGINTAMLNQQNRAKDRLYRNALEQQGVDTSNIKGYVTDDPFKNYTLANYRNRNLDVKMHLGTLNDNTKRAQLVNTMLNTGELDPVQAMELMNEYGLSVGQLDTSNQTKLLPYRQYAYKNGWNLGWANYGLKQEAANIKNEVLKELVGDTNGTAKQTVKVKAPNGKTGTIPIEQLEGALAAGYTRI